MDPSVLADRDCLVAFAAVVLCSDRGVRAHEMGYDHGLTGLLPPRLVCWLHEREA